LIVKCPASERWATNWVVSGMSPGTAESAGGGFSVEEAAGDAGDAGEDAEGKAGAGWDAEGEDAVAAFGAVLAQAPRRATSMRAARSRRVVCISPPLS
jgi:hypothetical protein